MTIHEARDKRNAWQQEGCPACEHVILVLQHDDRGYPTDQYVCTRCGSVICDKGALTSV